MKNRQSKKVAVIGGGVIGLVQACLLAEKAYDVTVYSADSLFKTTTIAAGAIWMPYKALPEAKAIQWAQASLAYYEALAGLANTGVVMRTHHVLFDQLTPKPSWLTALKSGLDPEFDMPSDVVSRYSVILPVIDPTVLVHYLVASLQALNVPIIYQKITTFESLKMYPFVVNATGLGARELVVDPSVFPIKGQTFLVEQPTPAIHQSFFFEQNNLATLVVPHQHHVTIGVSIIAHDASSVYNEKIEHQLRHSAERFYPQLKGSAVIERRLGHRSARDLGIRLEAEYLDAHGQWLLHSYGHAGGGVTMAPGCAYEIVDRIEVLANA